MISRCPDYGTRDMRQLDQVIVGQQRKDDIYERF